MPKLINPFNPGSGTPPPFLAGRDDDIAMFKESLDRLSANRSVNLILTGLQGTGKTVLLNEFNRICVEKGFAPIRRLQFAGKHNEPEEFYGALKSGMSAAISGISTKIGKKLKTGGSGKSKTSRVSDVIHYEPPYGSDSPPFEDHIEDYLSKNWDAFEKGKYKGVVFVFDEFHRLYDNTREKFHVLGDFIGTMNNLQNDGIPYHLVLAGLPKLPRNINNARSYAERMFRTVRLSNLSEDDAKMAIIKPLEDSPYSFTRDLVDAIIQDTSQYPYFVQFYCKEIIDNIPKKSICLKDYQSFKSVITKQFDIGFFDLYMESLTSPEKKILISMAKIHEQDMQFETILKKSEVKKASLTRYLDNMEKKGLVYNHRFDVYRFSLPLLRDYIIRNY